MSHTLNKNSQLIRVTLENVLQFLIELIMHLTVEPLLYSLQNMRMLKYVKLCSTKAYEQVFLELYS